MGMMKASTCDVASRTSFDSGGDEDGREPVLRDQTEGAAHGAAHRGRGGVSCLGVERREGGGAGRRVRRMLETHGERQHPRTSFIEITIRQYNVRHRRSPTYCISTD